ncbi:MAG: branched-chain amino acid ABC transporter permease [Syntrophorhabdaceae bacterium]|nr:branched-chain amino acid ABC transporter permease [Syntrophorhabdaceae bacterium]MDD4194947.1 branched-chain amino acid ABC transporter permease [Syntrophorhabdaceae bacterium]
MDAMMRKERIDRGLKVRTEGIYAISSLREILYLMGPRVLLIAGLFALPFIFELAPYWKKVINIMCAYALLALSFDFLANYAGLVCLGGAFFTGVGGYFAAIFNTTLGMPIWLSMPLATIAGAAFCTFFLLPCLPLRGVYFAIVTLMYPLLFTRIIEALDILGGTNGMSGIDAFPNTYVENYSIIAVALIFLFAMRRFVNQDIGLVLRGVKDNDQAVKASGISVTRMRIIAVFVASLIGCFAGAYIAHLYMWAGISLFALDFSIIPIAAVVIGGGGTLVGAMIGAFILVPLSEVLRAFGTFRIVIYCIILTGFIVFKSEGIMVYLQRKYHQFERWVKV